MLYKNITSGISSGAQVRAFLISLPLALLLSTPNGQKLQPHRKD